MSNPQKIRTEIDNLLEIFINNPKTKFEYKKLKELTALSDHNLKKFLKILKEEGYLDIEYNLKGDKYFLKEKKEIQDKSPIIFKHQHTTQKEQGQRQTEDYERIEQMLQLLLDKRTNYLKLKEKKEIYLKKGGMDHSVVLRLEKEIKDLKKEIAFIIRQIKTQINKLK